METSGVIRADTPLLLLIFSYIDILLFFHCVVSQVPFHKVMIIRVLLPFPFRLRTRSKCDTHWSGWVAFSPKTLFKESLCKQFSNEKLQARSLISFLVRPLKWSGHS